MGFRPPPDRIAGVSPIIASHAPDASFRERLRARLANRATGILGALALEALLIALLLTIGRASLDPEAGAPAISTFDVQPAAQSAPEEQQEQQPETSPEQSAIMREPDESESAPSDVALSLPEALPVPIPPPAVNLPRENTIDDFNLSDLPHRRPSRPQQSNAPAYGPALPSSSSDDTEIVGTAPDGEPLYAARWFREPSDQEMDGYLSTAQPGGYALIACKTAPRWRVEDCVGLEEYPHGSGLQRALLAAAWQFEVRPPRRGNTSLVGAWVRIRIVQPDQRLAP